MSGRSGSFRSSWGTVTDAFGVADLRLLANGGSNRTFLQRLCAWSDLPVTYALLKAAQILNYPLSRRLAANQRSLHYPPMVTNDFAQLTHNLIGLPVSTVWRGHGSALFLEFGSLTPRLRSSGLPAGSEGEMGLMIEWSWRIEQGNSIRCGSWSDESKWGPVFDELVGCRITQLTTFGVLHEISLTLDSNARLSSYMTAEGDPAWVLFDRRDIPARSYFSKSGQIHAE